MPSRSALIMIGLGISGVLLRSRNFTKASTPPSYFISSRFSTAWRLSDEDDGDAGIQECQFAQAVFECGEIELRHGEGLRARQEADFRAALALGIADNLERRHRDAVAEFDEVFLAVAPDGQLEPGGERVDHRDADAVQAARYFIGVLVEFSAGMELGHDDFGR